ncbi:hypothetical protein, variant [Aphanomyces invadans]|uniref:Uncharacterized protein n=1 Tax=Aphanomyces invadans TaxID=157072 RepID=A0A024TVW4_9STRA|nr:hypothetical protein, variant [Aphanomyces invadans]ETV98295.1 hypothetical protein, variant [Aphanomyces invadans]|eukprot:XP_008873170.1 hypothetical protein, variant [Aphanomyces invadans]
MLRRRDEQLRHMSWFRARRRLSLWIERSLHTKKRLRRLEHMTHTAWTAMRRVRGWIEWRQALAARQRIHAVDGIYTDRLLFKLVAHWKVFVKRTHRVRQYIAATHSKRAAQRKSLWFRAWKRQVVDKQRQSLRVTYLRDQHNVMSKRRVLVAIDTYRRWQQRQRYCMQLAQRHYDRLQRTRHLPLALFEWLAVLEDAHALQHLWMAQYREIHRKWTRKLVMRLWRDVATGQKKARECAIRQLKARAASLLRAWKSYTVAQHVRRAHLYVVQQDQEHRRLCFAWMEWRNLTCRLRAARNECRERYMRYRLVGLLACFVAWVRRYQSRRTLWQQAVAFRLITLRRACVLVWARWRGVFAHRQARQERILAMARFHEHQHMRHHLKAWKWRTWATGQVVQRRLLRTMELGRRAWQYWANASSRQRYIRQILAIQCKEVYRRQLHQWSAHFSQAQQLQAWQGHMVRLAASRRWYFQWRALFEHRQMTLQGIHSRRLHVKRKCWVLWKCLVAQCRATKRAMTGAATWHRHHVQHNVWLQWHTYHTWRTERTKQYRRATLHFERHRCKAAVAKLHDLWYFNTLMLSVHQHVARQHVVAWAALVRLNTFRRQRATASLVHMHQWHVRRRIASWHNQVSLKRDLRHRLYVGSRRRRQNVLVQVWRVWQQHDTARQGYSGMQAGQRRGLRSWRRFVQTKRYGHHVAAIAAKHHRGVTLAEGWRAWRRHYHLQQIAAHVIFHRRATWWGQWVKVLYAQRLCTRVEFTRVARLFRGWNAVVRLTMLARVGLCCVLERAIMSKVLRRWKVAATQRYKVRVAVLRCNREVVRSVFQAWFQGVTVRWLRRYHATRRCRALARTFLRRWFHAVGLVRMQTKQQQRVRRTVFDTWVGVTFVRQVMSTMAARRHRRWMWLVVWRWKHVVTVQQWIRRAQLRRVRNVWTAWFAIAQERATQIRTYNQLCRVLEREHVIERSLAFEQTMRMKNDLRSDRDLMKRVVRRWHHNVMASKQLPAY